MKLVIRHLPFAAALVAFLCIAFGAQEAACVVTAFMVTALGVKIVAQYHERKFLKLQSERAPTTRSDCLVVKPFSVYVNGEKLGTASEARVTLCERSRRASIDVKAYVMRQESSGESKIMRQLHYAFERNQEVSLVCGVVGDEMLAFPKAKCWQLVYETEHVKGTTIVKATFDAPINFIPEPAVGIDKLPAEESAKAHAKAVEQIAIAN